MIGIIDYGLGNLRSVLGAVEKVGYEACISADPATLADAEKLILPGVGAFGDGMANLHERGLVEPLSDLVVKRAKPILGICLGFQLIAGSSDEFGDHQGLGWVDGRVTRLAPDDASLRVPHVGWNDLKQEGDCVLFEDVPDGALFYFVHSFHMIVDDASLVMGTCDYGGRVVAAVRKRNIYATQFHPEKSQKHGLQLLKNFLERAQ